MVDLQKKKKKRKERFPPCWPDSIEKKSGEQSIIGGAAEVIGARDKEDKIALLKLARQAGNDFSSAKRGGKKKQAGPRRCRASVGLNRENG